MRAVHRVVSAFVVAVLALALGATAAVAQDEPAEGAILLIMDASGSMEATDADGVPLIDGAKEALRGVVETLPDGTNVGLRVYGHREPNTDEEAGCVDTELISPVEPLDREAMRAAIDGFEPSGFTPIGLSLAEAAGDLPPEGPRTIILVSDGEDTCAPPDPCDVAADLRADGVDLVVETVGFALGENEAAREQLQCIAEAGGGTFRDVATAAELVEELEVVSSREARRFVAAGDPVEGGPVPAEAPDIPANGVVTDTILPGEILYYRVPIDGPGAFSTRVTREGIEGGGRRRQLILTYTDAAAANRLGAVALVSDPLSDTSVLGLDPEELDGETTEIFVAVELQDGDEEPLEFPLQIETTFEAAPEPAAPEPTEEPTPQDEDVDADAEDDAAKPEPEDDVVAAEPAAASGLPGWVVPVVVVLGLLVAALGGAVIALLRRTSGGAGRA